MNTILTFYLIMSLVAPVLAEPGCLRPPGEAGRYPAERAGCGIGDLSSWVTDLPATAWQLAVSNWPRLFACVGVVLVLTFAVRVVHRAAWRQAVAGGYWVRVTPPRELDPGHAGDGWRLLAGLARLARHGWWRPAKPPLAFEVYQHKGRLTAGLWLPGWVPYAAVIDEASRVWPGARLDRTDPPTLTPHHDRTDDGGWQVAGVRLHASRPDTGFLVDDTHTTATPARGVTGGDRLQAVLHALGKPDGPALLQVLVRPAPAGRLTALDRASRYPAKPRMKASAVVLDHVTGLLLGAVRLVLDLITELIGAGRTASSPRHRISSGDGSRRVDPVTARAMREAAEKLAGGPHVIAAVRVGVARPGRGFARAAARSIGYGFRTVARHLFPARMRSAATLLEQRRATSGEWLLLSTAELAVLAHLPADPARHGFDTTALHRRWPGGVSQADPERSTRHASGWTPTGWTSSTTTQDAADGNPTEYDHTNTGDEPPLEAV
jgi:hypothetical protein